MRGGARRGGRRARGDHRDAVPVRPPAATLVLGRRTGPPGAVRALLTGADVAMVNLECPTPDDFTYHRHGLVFTCDPALLDGVVRSGIDFVSLANNHIGNGGPKGVTDTVRHLDARGIRHAGAGADLAAARTPAWFRQGDVDVAVLAYDAVDAHAPASPTTPGNAPFRASLYRADIAAARDAGAEVVIVWPHWGAEYVLVPSRWQRDHARALVAAGADLVLGNHSHWAGGLGWVEGRLVVYSLGNLVFDLLRSEGTMEGLLVELTFRGRRLVQAALRPTVLIDTAQPNLLDPAGHGRVVLDRVRAASRGLLPW